jgi:hypothetical protein
VNKGYTVVAANERACLVHSHSPVITAGLYKERGKQLPCKSRNNFIDRLMNKKSLTADIE